MPVINFVPCDNGELLYSWFCRVAEANASDVKFFADSFLHESLQTMRAVPLRYDSSEYIGGILNEFDQFFANDYERIVRFFLSHSLYGPLSPFISEISQTNHILSMFCFQYNASPNHRKNIKLLKRNILKLCPKCFRQEGPIYKRIHQIPGVNICPYHNCRLQIFSGKLGFEFTESEISTIDNPNYLPLESEYSIFYEAFQKISFECSAEDTKQAICKKLSIILFKHISSREFSKWLKEKYGFSRRDFGLLIPIDNYFNNGLSHDIPIKELMMMIFLLFDSPEEFLKYLPFDEKFKFTFEDKVNNLNLTLLSRFRKNIMVLKRAGELGHQNNIFISTARGLLEIND